MTAARGSATSRNPRRAARRARSRFAERFLDERFLALNGDVLTDLDLTALMDLHEQRGATATLALYPVDDPSAYGLVRRKEDGEIVEFLEKPDPKQIDTDEINAGAYVLERSVLDLIPSDREVSIEREVFPSWWARACMGSACPATGWTSAPRAIPGGELGHPRAPGRDRGRRAHRRRRRADRGRRPARG